MQKQCTAMCRCIQIKIAPCSNMHQAARKTQCKGMRFSAARGCLKPRPAGVPPRLWPCRAAAHVPAATTAPTAVQQLWPRAAGL